MFRRWRIKWFGLTREEKRYADAVARMVATLPVYICKHEPGDLEIIYGTKRLDPQEATRLIG